jgi:hypothetical protein
MGAKKPPASSTLLKLFLAAKDGPQHSGGGQRRIDCSSAAVNANPK